MESSRRVQLTGRNTYIISLPHEWVIKNKIVKGAEVFLVEVGSNTLNLSLSPTKKEFKTCTIEVSRASVESSMRNIVSAYVGGAGKIILKGMEMSSIAEEARRVLSGVEITEETSEYLTLKVLTFDDIDVDGIIKRAFNVTQSMFELAITAYREDADVFIEIAKKEDDVDRLYLLLLRILGLGNFNRDFIFKASSAKSIEKISDHLEDICASEKQVGKTPIVADLISQAAIVYTVAYQAFSKNELDRGQFADAKKEYMTRFARAEAALKKEKNISRALTLRALLEKCNKILRYSEDIMETSSDMYFARME
jgi:phosphate uptake regulator